ncbi:MAG: hypothetical protein P1U57_05615 [Oleibacter sp.]|nr:hypothetical protein [Thalassolituus sp.]
MCAISFPMSDRQHVGKQDAMMHYRDVRIDSNWFMPSLPDLAAMLSDE